MKFPTGAKLGNIVHDDLDDWKEEDDDECEYEEKDVARTANRATFSLIYFMKYRINWLMIHIFI